MDMTQRKSSYEDGTSFDEEREHMHRQLFSAVSHDLKTPLASMIGSLEIHQRMKQKLASDKKDALIATALQEAYRLDNFVTNILDMGKLESNMVKIRKERVDISHIVKDCLTNLDNRLAHCEVEVKALSGELVAQTDPSLLSRALSLVLDNAVKYGGTPPKIMICHGVKDGAGYISVLDNGKGVPEAQYGKVFEKYTRFTKSDQQSAGTGLGLAICREIMRLLGGSVAVVTPTEGMGALFTLTFPL